jgi:hypothetical protein
MEKNLETPGEFFFKEKPNNTNISHILKLFHILGYSKEYLSPVFQFS